MAEPTTGPDEAALGALARHALHDEELVAAFAADDVDDAADAHRARALVERCATCRDLYRDLVGIRAAIRASGTAMERTATVTAPRDFRLTAEDAARLRPGTSVARLATRLGLRARLGLGVAAFGRPLGAALATFGIAGLLLGAVTLNTGMNAFSAAGQYQPAPEVTRNAAGYGPSETLTGDSTVGETVPTSRDLLEPGQLAALLIAGGLALLVLGVALVLAARRNLASVRDG